MSERRGVRIYVGIEVRNDLAGKHVAPLVALTGGGARTRRRAFTREYLQVLSDVADTVAPAMVSRCMKSRVRITRSSCSTIPSC